MSEEKSVALHRMALYDRVRESVFGGHLTPEQVAGMEAILDEWERGYPKGEGDLRHLGYILGTAWWETGKRMVPVPEVGRGRGRSYGKPSPKTGRVYYGRGPVQLTWESNYKKMSPVVGVDLVTDPDKALDPHVGARIIIQGMLRGMFTGKRLSTYINGSKCDYVGARRIVNGTDRASEIAQAAVKFTAALHLTEVELPLPPMPEPTKETTMPEIVKSGSTAGTLALIGAIALAFGRPQLAEAIQNPATQVLVDQVLLLGAGFIAHVVGRMKPHAE
jgi:putative chitinase